MVPQILILFPLIPFCAFFFYLLHLLTTFGLFALQNLSKEDDVRKYVIRREVPSKKEGKKVS